MNSVSRSLGNSSKFAAVHTLEREISQGSCDRFDVRNRKRGESTSALYVQFSPVEMVFCVMVNLGGIRMVVDLACSGPRTAETTRNIFAFDCFVVCCTCCTLFCQKVGP